MKNERYILAFGEPLFRHEDYTVSFVVHSSLFVYMTYTSN